MKKIHIIWLLLIVGIGIAAFYGYRVQQEAAQAPSSAHQQATVTDETEAADTSADDEAAGVDAVSEDIAAEEAAAKKTERSEEHTSELQSRGHLVCRLLLEKKHIL